MFFHNCFIDTLQRGSAAKLKSHKQGSSESSNSLPSVSAPAPPVAAARGKPLPPSQRAALESEEWFHGPISRREAEVLLINVSQKPCKHFRPCTQLPIGHKFLTMV